MAKKKRPQKHRRVKKDFDHQPKYVKMRRGKKTHVNEVEQDFSVPESQWHLKNGMFRARVVEVHKRYAFVSPETTHLDIQTRDVWLASVARKYLTATRKERNFICVGDRVLCQKSDETSPEQNNDLPYCIIQNRAPRIAEITRIDPHYNERLHIIAANMSQLVIVASFLKPTVKWGLIDRYLIQAEYEEIRPLIVLNKYDILMNHEDNSFKQDAEEKVNLYRSLGYDVFTTNATKEDDDEVVRFTKELGDRITLVSGHSGVGKSSLVNLCQPEIEQEVEENDDIFYKGRHTTTYASLIKLGTGGYIIDTPGVRSFTFPELDPVQLTHCFIEFRPFIGQCRYRECRHYQEPDCAIKQAVSEGTISQWRYKSFLGILSGASGREGRIRDLDEAEPQED